MNPSGTLGHRPPNLPNRNAVSARPFPPARLTPATSPSSTPPSKHYGMLQCQPFQEGQLDATRQGRTLFGMDHGKNKSSGSREASKKGPALGWVIALAAAGGVVIGSAGTYFLFKPLIAPKQSASPAAGETTPAQTVTMPTQPQFTPAPQPPGEAPPGKVWSVEHGHWHDAPVALTPPAPAPLTVTPAATTPPAPAAAPVEKKE